MSDCTKHKRRHCATCGWNYTTNSYADNAGTLSVDINGGIGIGIGGGLVIESDGGLGIQIAPGLSMDI